MTIVVYLGIVERAGRLGRQIRSWESCKVLSIVLIPKQVVVPGSGQQRYTGEDGLHHNAYRVPDLWVAVCQGDVTSEERKVRLERSNRLDRQSADVSVAKIGENAYRKRELLLRNLKKIREISDSVYILNANN